MLRPLLSLNAIVKNEATNIANVLFYARDAVDHVTILDTGSTDNTRTVLRSHMNAPSGDRLHEEGFVPFTPLLPRRVIDFAATRNRALELEQLRPLHAEPVHGDRAVFVLIMSGSERLEGAKELQAFLEQQRDTETDAFAVTMVTGGNTEWPFPRILRVDGGRRFRFPIHEVPVSASGQQAAPLIPGVRIVHEEPDAHRLFTRMREVDLPVLEHMADHALVDTHEEQLGRARALLNLGMTHRKLAEFARPNGERLPGSVWLSHQFQAMAYLMRRHELGGDAEEANYAAFQYLNVAQQVGLYAPAELVTRLEALQSFDPTRPEVAYMLAVEWSKVDVRQGAAFARQAIEVATAARKTPPRYPVDNRIEWLSYLLAAGCAAQLKKPERAQEMARRGLSAGGPEAAFAEYLS